MTEQLQAGDVAARLDELRVCASQMRENAEKERGGRDNASQLWGEAAALLERRITALEAEQDRSRLTDPCQFCGTPVRTDTETDTSWPFEYPRREGNTTVSQVHTPERCVEVRTR